jgi:hypothetical protein
MKVSQLIKVLQEQNKPDDEILVLWWEKHHFDFPEDYEIKLTDEGWMKISKEFDSWDNAGEEIGEWIADASVEHAEINALPIDGGGNPDTPPL